MNRLLLPNMKFKKGSLKPFRLPKVEIYWYKTGDNFYKENMKYGSFSNAYQSALNRISRHCVNIHYEEDDTWHEHACEEELKLLQELVDKETPKKPHYEGDGMWNGQIVYDTWICPNCGKSYEVDYEEYERCPHCGQAIYWTPYEVQDE